MTLRPATDDDLGLLTEYLRQLQAAHGEDRHPTERLRARMAELMRHSDAVMILSDQAPAGYALLKDCGDHMFVRHFMIAEGARRDGLGRAAFAALEAAHFRGRQLRLDASLKVPAPRAFWEAMGFTAYAWAMRRDPPRETA